MPVFILSPDAGAGIAGLEAKLRSEIPDLVRISSVDEIANDLSARSSGKVVVLFVSPTIERQSLDRLVDISARYRDRILFILISDSIATKDYKRLVRTGGADWVATDGTAQEVLEIISRHNATIKPDATNGSTPEARKRPTVISFVPSAGGVGNTTVALESALQLKLARTKKPTSICYVDLDFQNSNVCDYLDVEPRLQITEISEAPERLDDQLFGIFLTHHSSGLDVLASARKKFDSSDIGLDALDTLFELISKQYGTIFVDLPVQWQSWTTPIITNSDAVVITGLNTVPCLRQVAGTLAHVRERASAAQIAVVINRYKTNFLGGIARRQHVDSVLKGEKIFYVRDEPLAVDSVNIGAPLSLGSGAGRIKKEFAALAKFCAGVAASESR
jgi:pilus assembly protein CpaE